MTSHTCIAVQTYMGSHDPARGLPAYTIRVLFEAAQPLTRICAGLDSAVTLLMARVAPSNFGVKLTAGRLPRPAAEPPR